MLLLFLSLKITSLLIVPIRECESDKSALSVPQHLTARCMCRDQASFHGIIFSRTRQGAHYLAEVLRAMSAPSSSQKASRKGDEGGGSMSRPGEQIGDAPLGFIQGVYVFVGHGLRYY